jgi:hypothetical protein
MTGIPFIKDLFTATLLKSAAIQGRLFLCPKMGREINTDELDKVLQDLVVPGRLEKKYPLSLLMPPVSQSDYTKRGGSWDDYRLIMFFLTTSNYSGTGQTMMPNNATRTSTHTVDEDWHDMKRCASNFIYALGRVQKEKGLIHSKFRLDQSKGQIITPVSSIGIDRVSGVRMDFNASIFIACDQLEDYQADDITNIIVPGDDSHPEHQL